MDKSGLSKFIEVLKRFARLNRESGKKLILVISLIVISNVLAALNNYYIGRVTDLITSDKIQMAITVFVILFILQLIKLPFVYYSNRETNYLCEDCIKRTREYTYDHITQASMKWLDESRIGDILSRVNGDLNRLAAGMNMILTWQMADLIQCSVAIIVCFILNWKLSLISFLIFPILIFLKTRIVAPVEKYSAQRATSEGALATMFVDLIKGIPIVKAFGIEQKIEEKYNIELKKCVAANIKASKVEFAVFPVQLLVMLVPRILIMAAGTYFVVQGELSIGGFITFILLVNNVIEPIGLLAWEIREAFEVSGVASRIFEIWDVQEEGKGGEIIAPKSDVPVELKNVVFSYNSNQIVLNGVNCKIHAGEHIAFVGESGSGKTTILKLLAAFYEKTDGDIIMFGAKIDDWKRVSLRSNISYVGQDSFLFAGNIFDNVRLGRRDAKDAEVLDVIKMVGLDDLDIHKEIGESGVKLSGGQRQRVCIARAMLKNAPLILLDEPTSALDTESEYQVTKAIEKLIEGKTCITVAHRLSTIVHSDNIFVLDHGMIVEEGTHSDLMKKKNVYYRLYNKQEKEGNEDE